MLTKRSKKSPKSTETTRLVLGRPGLLKNTQKLAHFRAFTRDVSFPPRSSSSDSDSSDDSDDSDSSGNNARSSKRKKRRKDKGSREKHKTASSEHPEHSHAGRA